MRITVLISALFFSATGMAETVFIEPIHDNTMYQHALGALSNGADGEKISNVVLLAGVEDTQCQ
jgi:hypothetical protein